MCIQKSPTQFLLFKVFLYKKWLLRKAPYAPSPKRHQRNNFQLAQKFKPKLSLKQLILYSLAKKAVKPNVLLDTGSDPILFTTDVAQLLNLKRKKQEKSLINVLWNNNIIQSKSVNFKILYTSSCEERFGCLSCHVNV